MAYSSTNLINILEAPLLFKVINCLFHSLFVLNHTRQRETLCRCDKLSLTIQFDDTYYLQIFFFSISSCSALKSTQLRIQWLMQALFPGIKKSRHETDLSHSPTVEVKEVWNYTSTPPCAFKVWKGINLPFTHGKLHLYPFLS